MCKIDFKRERDNLWVTVLLKSKLSPSTVDINYVIVVHEGVGGRGSCLCSRNHLNVLWRKTGSSLTLIFSRDRNSPLKKWSSSVLIRLLQNANSVYTQLKLFSLIHSCCPGSRGSHHSTDSGTTSDSTETRDTVFDETASPFRSSLEMSPPVSPSTPPLFQKGAYISKVKSLVHFSSLTIFQYGVSIFVKFHLNRFSGRYCIKNL